MYASSLYPSCSDSAQCSCLFSYSWPHVEYFFEKLVVAHLVTTFPLSYCIVRSSNISTLASRLTRFCARRIRFKSCHTLFKIRFNIVLVSVTSFQILLLQFCINFFSFSSRTAQSEFRWGQEFFSSAKRSAGLLGPHSFLLNGYRGKALPSYVQSGIGEANAVHSFVWC